MDDIERKLEYVAASEKDLRKLPFEVQELFSQALELAKIGEKHIDAKPMKGFKG
jgi:phage-related protein